MHKLDKARLADHLHLTLASRNATSRQLHLATPNECVTVFGYRPGTVPPLGHRDLAMRVVVDAGCVSLPHRPLLAGGGDFGVSAPTPLFSFIYYVFALNFKSKPLLPRHIVIFSKQVALLLDTAALLSQRHVTVAKLSLESV